MAMRGAGQIAKAHHREVVRHAHAAAGGFGQHTLGQGVGAAHHHLAGRARIEQAGKTLTTDGEGRRCRQERRGQRRHTVPCQCRDQAVAAAQATGIVKADQRYAAVALAQQILRNGRANRFMGKAHQHVQRLGAEVPGFQQRNADTRQAFVADLAMLGTGEHDAVRPASEHGLEQAFLLFGAVAGQPQQGLVAGDGQPLGQCLNGIGEDRIGNGRQKDRNQSAAAGRQRAGCQIGHVSGGSHRLQHPPARRRCHCLGPTEGARHDDRRNTGNPGHVDQRRRGPCTGTAAAFGHQCYLRRGAASATNRDKFFFVWSSYNLMMRCGASPCHPPAASVCAKNAVPSRFTGASAWHLQQ